MTAPTNGSAMSASPKSSPSHSRSQSSSQHSMRSNLLSVEFGDASPAGGRPRRHPMVAHGGNVETFDENIHTLYETFNNAVTKFAGEPFLGWRPRQTDGQFGPYRFMTYGEVKVRVDNIAAGLASFGMPEKSNIGLYSINRPEWVLAEYACYFNNFVTIPLYDTLGDEAVTFICNQTEMEVMVASNDKSQIPALKTIICMDETIPEELSSVAATCKVELVRLSSVEKRGAEAPCEPRKPSPEDLFTICYTSGTTGQPKGVMLPHRAIIAEASAVLALAGVIGKGSAADPNAFLFHLGPEVVHISYLPLAHVYERIVISTLASVGASIGFYQGDVLKLMDDIAALRPTLFVTVPRLLNRIYDKILAGVGKSGMLKKFLFDLAYRSKVSNLQKSGDFTHWLWDRVVFSTMRNRLGGRVSAILTGSAPISPEVMDFLRVCFCCEVYEGYGQTETSAASTLTVRGDWTSGQIGVPLPCNEVKLVDIPEMNYTTNDTPHPRGEICIRGSNCFVGYYKMEELTRETLDADGWVHTGDVGEWDKRGRLKVIDRKKNIFKLAQGEYISPEKIENVLCRNKYVAQAFVEGISLKSCLVAVVVPDFEVLEGWARENGIEYERNAELCKVAAVKELLKKEIRLFGRDGSNDLKGFEIPREIHIEDELFTVANNMLTSTMKLKRHEAKQRYAAKVAEMYVQINE